MTTDTVDSTNAAIFEEEYQRIHDTNNASGGMVHGNNRISPLSDASSTRSLSVCSSGESTASAAVCRICQLTEIESGEALETTGCKCRGSIQMCHRECIKRWIQTRRSIKCELCNSPMQYEVLFRLSGVGSQRNAVALFDSDRTYKDKRRSWFLMIFIMLVGSTCTSITMTVRTRTEYQFHSHHADSTHYDNAMKIALSVTALCGSICTAFGLIWIVWETVVWPRERQLIREMRQWERSFHVRTAPMEHVMTGNNIRIRNDDPPTIETTVL